MADAQNNGPACCILGLKCCPPPEGATIDDAQKDARKFHLSRMLRKLCPKLSQNDAIELAEGILAEYDLVPSGVGLAIAQGYARFIKSGG